MFLHILKYSLKSGLRNKDLIIWLILFPIILGTFFKIAFGSIYEKTDKFSSIPVAVVEEAEDPAFSQVLESMANSDEPFLKVSYADKEKAEEMLESGDIEGVIFSGDGISLTVKEKGLRETMLKSFVEQYSVREKIAQDAIISAPEKAQEIISSLASEAVGSCREIPVTQGNPDIYIQFFYNLIAMVALFGNMTGMAVMLRSQADLSVLGARNSCSPAPKSISVIAGILSGCILHTFCMLLCVTFLAFVLKIDFGDRLWLVYLTAIAGGMLGVSFGFFIGSLARVGEKAKTAILMTSTMLLCFFSGLMVGDMKSVVAKNIPWFNNINPAAVISDSFYCLNIYEDYDRYITKLITMAVITIVFAVLGILTSRRKKYASV